MCLLQNADSEHAGHYLLSLDSVPAFYFCPRLPSHCMNMWLKKKEKSPITDDDPGFPQSLLQVADQWKRPLKVPHEISQGPFFLNYWLQLLSHTHTHTQKGTIRCPYTKKYALHITQTPGSDSHADRTHCGSTICSPTATAGVLNLTVA